MQQTLWFSAHLPFRWPGFKSRRHSNFQGHQMSTSMLLTVGKNFCRSLLYLAPNQSDTNDDDDDEDPTVPRFECRASVEKDDALKITR